MFLSKLGYSELVQRLFEKMTFFLVDPGISWESRSVIKYRGDIIVRRDCRARGLDPSGISRSKS